MSWMVNKIKQIPVFIRLVVLASLATLAVGTSLNACATKPQIVVTKNSQDDAYTSIANDISNDMHTSFRNQPIQLIEINFIHPYLSKDGTTAIAVVSCILKKDGQERLTLWLFNMVHTQKGWQAEDGSLLDETILDNEETDEETKDQKASPTRYRLPLQRI